jgi:hypothetical protein
MLDQQQKSDQNSVCILTGISPNTCGHVRETTAGERFKLRNLESFDPVTQEPHRGSPATIHTKADNPNSMIWSVKIDAKQAARSRRVSRADLALSVLYHNRQTEAHLVLRPKPRNHRSDFEAWRARGS